MESLNHMLGTQTMVDDFADLSMKDIPQYNPYEDESQNIETFPILDEKQQVTTEGGSIFKCRVFTFEREQND